MKLMRQTMVPIVRGNRVIERMHCVYLDECQCLNRMGLAGGTCESCGGAVPDEMELKRKEFNHVYKEKSIDENQTGSL
jgi:hypothetical protein